MDDEISVMSAIHLGRVTDEPNPSLIPLARGSADVWFDGADPSEWDDLTIRPVLSGPIAGLHFVRDWLGDFPLLMLQPYHQVRHGLTPSRSGDLQLIDTGRHPAVVFGYWKENVVGQSIGERLEGCELSVPGIKQLTREELAR